MFPVFYLIRPTLLSSDDSKVQENKKQSLIWRVLEMYILLLDGILSLPEQVCDVYSFYGALLKLTFSLPILQAWERSGKVWA